MIEHPIIRRRLLQAARAQARHLGHDLTPFYDDDESPRCFVSYCRICGMQASLISGPAGPGQGQALKVRCDGDHQRMLESLAEFTGRIPRLLLKRLSREVERLSPKLKPLFAPGVFSPGEQALFSDDGVWSLRWYPPEDCEPDAPIDESKPGEVDLRRLVPKTSIAAARHIGPSLNPNIGDDPKRWLFQILQTGEMGLGYQDHEGRWRFRRTHGVIGYYVSQQHLQFIGAVPVASHMAASRMASRMAAARMGMEEEVFLPDPG